MLKNKVPKKTDGTSLRDLIERRLRQGKGKNKGKPPKPQKHYAVSESGKNNQLMMRHGDLKLIMPNRASAKMLNALYNLKDDPGELVNLIGPSFPRRKHFVKKAQELKSLLVQWCMKTKSPHTKEIRRRRILTV